MINNHPAMRIFAALLIPTLFFWGCSEKKKEIKKAEKAIPVITGQSTTRRVEYVLNEVGTLKACQEVTIRSEIEGRVIEILFNEGRAVKKADILVRLDSAKVQAEIRSLDARIEQLHIRLKNKKRTLERKRPLVKQNLVSQLQFDDLHTEIQEIDAQIVQTRADLTRQKELFSYTVMRAPFEGMAGARNFSVGHYLKVGDPVVAVVQLDPLEIEFHVPEKYKSNLFYGQDLMFSVESQPGQTFKGQIFFISPQVEIGTRTFQVKARIKNNKHLLSPGMFARVKIIMDIHENALTVPWESIIHTEKETYLYVVDGGMARKIPIRLGKTTSEWAEILDNGITAGSTVILEGKFAVKEGMKVSALKSTRRIP